MKIPRPPSPVVAMFLLGWGQSACSGDGSQTPGSTGIEEAAGGSEATEQREQTPYRGQEGGTSGEAEVNTPGEPSLTSIVPGGEFLMGRGQKEDACPTGESCGPQEEPEHSVFVSGFRLDVFEVSVEKFRQFVDVYDDLILEVGTGVEALPNSAEALKNALACGTYATWTSESGEKEQYPLNCATWAEAMVYCHSVGGSLPTEAQWEFAASGGSENRLYPWGDQEPTAERAVFFPSELSPVGTRQDGVGRFGHHDLAGGVWEWNLDWLDTTWYAEGGSECDDCARTSSGTHRVIRGGAYSYQEGPLRAAARSGKEPGERDDSIGFRCAYPLEEDP